ncbi:MAG: SprT-like family protein, partial [Isosphaeraceae bacterium]
MIPDASQDALPVPPGIGDRPARLHAIHHTLEEVERKTRAIHADVLATSPHVREPNFQAIGVDDLQSLFDRYDADLYDGLLRQFLKEDRGSAISFRLSKRMTNAAGKASRQRLDLNRPSGTVAPFAYEIAVSTTILFGSFNAQDQPMKVGGRLCHDRLEALQRTFEHETLHVAEFLAWGVSNCS